MKEYHMSYDEYMETPVWVIDLIIEKNQLDYKVSQM